MRKARVRADSTRVRSTNETSLCIAIKKEKPLQEEPGRASGAAWCSGGLDPASTECVGVVLSSNGSGSQSPIA